MKSLATRLGSGGRLLIPAAMRQELGITAGSTLILHVEAHGLLIQTPQEALKPLQEAVRNLIPPGTSVVDELIADRRREAERE